MYIRANGKKIKNATISRMVSMSLGITISVRHSMGCLKGSIDMPCPPGTTPSLQYNTHAAEDIKNHIVVRVVISSAKPAELVVAFVASHVVAAALLLDRRAAVRAVINEVILPSLQVELILRIGAT